MPNREVQLLVCTCGDCTHWEIGHNFIKCLTCGKEFHEGHGIQVIAPKVVNDLGLSWERHER